MKSNQIKYFLLCHLILETVTIITMHAWYIYMYNSLTTLGMNFILLCIYSNFTHIHSYETMHSMKKAKKKKKKKKKKHGFAIYEFWTKW